MPKIFLFSKESDFKPQKPSSLEEPSCLNVERSQGGEEMPGEKNKMVFQNSIQLHVLSYFLSFTNRCMFRRVINAVGWIDLSLP